MVCLPSPWIKSWFIASSWLCCSLMSATFFLPFTNHYKLFTESTITLLISSIRRLRIFPFFLAPAVIHSIISFSKDLCAIMRCTKYRIFSIFVIFVIPKISHYLVTLKDSKHVIWSDELRHRLILTDEKFRVWRNPMRHWSQFSARHYGGLQCFHNGMVHVHMAWILCICPPINKPLFDDQTVH